MNNIANLQGFTDAQYFHSVLESCFEGDRQHPLWALDGIQIIMVSTDKPKIPQDFGSSVTKPYTPQIPNNAILTYKITANPTIRLKGKRVPLNLSRTKQQPYCAVDWLKDRLNANGAKVITCSVTSYKTKNAKHNKICFLTTTFEGQLQVTDCNAFNSVLLQGLGHEKAYGCGLLMVKL